MATSTQIRALADGPGLIVATKPAAPAVARQTEILPFRGAMPVGELLTKRLPANARLRTATALHLQRRYGNAAVGRLLRGGAVSGEMISRKCGCQEVAAKEEQCPACESRGSQVQREVTVQRLSLNPLEWANDLLRRVTGDAESDQAEAQRDAEAKAGEAENQGTTQSAHVQGDAQSQRGSLEGEAQTQSGQVTRQGTAEEAALQSQGQGEGAQLNAASATQSAAVQQAASSTSTRLEGQASGLESDTRSSNEAATQKVQGEINGGQAQGEATEAQVRGQWTAVENRGTGKLAGLTSQTQALIDQRTAVVAEYQSPGTHDPESFQKRWKGLQQQVERAEQQESSLQGIEQAGGATTSQAETLWGRLSGRGQELVGRAESLASSAWSGFQRRWSGLQQIAGQALAGVRDRAGAAVARLQNLVSGAWKGLQNLASQAAARVKDFAANAWNGLKNRVTSAWNGLKGRATAAWTALQAAASAAVGALSSKISGIISRISGTLGQIIEWLASAVSSLISRVRNATGQALGYLRGKAEAAWNGLKNVGTRAWEGLKDWGESAWGRLKDIGGRVWDRLKDIGGRVWQGLKSLGERLWAGLKSLAQRAWDMLNRAWEALKKKLTAAWEWLKRAWEAVKKKAAAFWNWLKKKTKQVLDWLKKKWEWLKALIRKGLEWLKEKWKWLKSLVKFTIRIPDQTLCKLRNFKPWQFANIHTGRVPLAKGFVDPGIGPVELTLFVEADAVASLGGTLGPCMLKNIMFTLQPLISRYTGQADLHVPGTAWEKLVLTGTIGGTANYGGLIGLVGGGLKGTGTATALASVKVSPRFVYDSGKIVTSVPVRLEFCVMPQIDLDAFIKAQLIAGAPPTLPPPSPAPIVPGPISLSSRLRGAGCRSLAVPGTGPAAAPRPGEPPPEKVLKERIWPWRLRSWKKKECWNVGVRFTVISGPGGLPELDVEFEAKPASMSDVIRSLFDQPPLPSGGAGPVAPVGPSSGPSGPAVGPVGPVTPSEKEPCDDPLPIDWPSALPVPSDGLPLRRNRSGDSGNEWDGDERGPEQRKMQKEIKRRRDRCRNEGICEPPPQPCSDEDEDPNAVYDAHHIHPIYLGGKDQEHNLCSCETGRHQKGHRSLDNQKHRADTDPTWQACCVTEPRLSKHPTNQQYEID